MKKAIDIIEFAKSYYLLASDHRVTGSKPILVGGRIKLEFASSNFQSIDRCIFRKHFDSMK